MITGKKSLRISSWNIGLRGLKSTFNNFPEFIHHIKDFDILCFQEAWINGDSNEEISSQIPIIPNFSHYFCCRKKKQKGGILIYVKNCYQKGIKRIKKQRKDIIWLRLDKHFFWLAERLVPI